MSWKPEADEIAQRHRWAEALGGEESIKRHHERGRLTIRERIAALLDPGSFHVGTTDKNGLDLKIAWPSAEWGSLPVEGGVAAAYRREIEAAPDPTQRVQEIEAKLRQFASPVLTAEAFAVEDVIDPRDTRPYLCRFIDAMQGKLATSVGSKAKSGVRP